MWCMCMCTCHIVACASRPIYLAAFIIHLSLFESWFIALVHILVHILVLTLTLTLILALIVVQFTVRMHRVI